LRPHSTNRRRATQTLSGGVLDLGATRPKSRRGLVGIEIHFFKFAEIWLFARVLRGLLT